MVFRWIKVVFKETRDKKRSNNNNKKEEIEHMNGGEWRSNNERVGVIKK